MRGGGFGGGRGGGFSADDLKGKIYDRRLYSRMLRYVVPYLKLVILSFAILMLVAVAEIVLPLIQRSAIDNHIVSDKTLVIYDNPQDATAFRDKYHFLKFKEYAYKDKHFVIMNTRDRNKLDRGELKALEDRGLTGKQYFFVIKDIPANRNILKQYILEIDKPGFTKYGLAGWFKISDELIVVERGLVQRLPNKARLELRKDASQNLLYLALLFLGIITVRMFSSYFQSVIT
ncbi:MAG TPA: ABC transporter ATP-binding protein, partial [Candidatus Cloacimonadota bacterium]|nr:ABC transporter ATP-binding protein [Candidatus Cloacimonadota bacterium]